MFTHYHDFWSQIVVVILVTPKQEVERKSEWFCGVKFFRSNFNVDWEKSIWTKIRFLASGFCSHAAISLWFLLFFFRFFVDIFFSFNPNRVIGINGGYFPAICRVCLTRLLNARKFVHSHSTVFLWPRLSRESWLWLILQLW